MTVLRLIYGIFLGTIAVALMGLANMLGLSQTSWPREIAILITCRMFALGGGLDDGALSLVDGWGPSAIHTLHLMRQRAKIPHSLASAAYALDREDDTLDILRCKFSLGEMIEGVHFRKNQVVLIVDGARAGMTGRVAGLYDFQREPLYRLEINGQEEYAHQSEIEAADG